VIWEIPATYDKYDPRNTQEYKLRMEELSQ
jgi:hypothetical protein